MTFPLAHQRQPKQPWGRWIVTGNRQTGKSYALDRMALERALAGDDVAFVVSHGTVDRVLDRIAQHARTLDLTGADPLAWVVDANEHSIAPAGLNGVAGGKVRVITVRAGDRVFGRRFQTVAVDDVAEDERHAERELVRNIRMAGALERLAIARFDSEGTGEVAVRSWYSTDAP